MRTIVLLDVDHTVSDAAWRDHMIGDWDRYYAHQYEDKPIEEVVRMVKCLSRGRFGVYALTARPEKYRQVTEDWLRIHDCDVLDVIMRPEGNHEPSPILKPSLALARFRKEDIAFAIEDREDVALAMRAVGISVLQLRHIKNNPFQKTRGDHG